MKVLRDMCLGLVAMAMTLTCFAQGFLPEEDEIHIATACYGTVYNYLRLDCQTPARISIHRVVHGAKPMTEGCSTPANEETYNKSCCQMEKDDDCFFTVTSPSANTCENRTFCRVVATWSTTTTFCDQQRFPPNTHYAHIEYYCIYRSIEHPFPVITTNRTTPATTMTAKSTKSILEVSSHPTSTPWSQWTSPVRSTETNSMSLLVDEDNQHSEDDELSDAMVGAIVAGSLGMVLTLTVFILYWGRKRRRLRIVGKPAPTVWDYLLNTTFTVRGTMGYDQFPSVRSSISSDGDQYSPTLRKNLWLPNIAPQRSPTLSSRNAEVLSNYDNDSTRGEHRVELHHTARPSPYAILNLECPADQQQPRRPSVQEA